MSKINEDFTKCMANTKLPTFTLREWLKFQINASMMRAKNEDLHQEIQILFEAGFDTYKVNIIVTPHQYFIADADDFKQWYEGNSCFDFNLNRLLNKTIDDFTGANIGTDIVAHVSIPYEELGLSAKNNYINR